MAVIGLPRAGVQLPAVGAPPKPSAALAQWVAAHYAKPLQAGVLMRLAQNPTRAAQLTMPNVGQLLHPGGFDISRYHFPGGPPAAPTTTPAVATPVAAAPANPYAAYPDYAQTSLRQMDADQAAAQQNATTTAAWLAPALQALQTGQQQAQGAYASTLAGLYQNPGTQGPAQVSATSPGGVLSGPVNASLQAMQQAAPLHAAAQQQMGAVNSLLGNLKVGDLGAGALGNLAYQAGQIPNVFAAKKSDYLATLDKALTDAQQQATSDAAKLAQNQAQFEVQNATTLRGQDIGLARTALGTGSGASGTKVSSSVIPITPGTAAPAGYNTVTAADGNTYAVKAPASAKPSTGSGGMYIPGAQNQQLVKQGYTPVRVPGGFRYVKPGGGTTATTGKAYQTLIANWSKEANKRLQGKRVSGGSTSTVNAQGATVTTPRYTVQGQQHPEAVFSQMLAAGVQPKDAYRIVNANAPQGVGLDSLDVYNALSTSNLTAKQAQALAMKVTGVDPVSLMDKTALVPYS
jgi:hypothetical protein